MRHRKLIKTRTSAMAIMVVMALSWLCQTAKPEYTVSLITCYPGPEIYELCGHAAVRVRGNGIDSVWNFGIFDFNQPNFIYRFVKGETDYKCAAYPFSWFLPEYIQRGSKVVEQDLNLKPEETQKMLSLLRESAKPENATYRYNYVKDNCATRILDKVDKSTSERVIYPDSIRYGTFRNEMRAYHEGYPWYQFGIDLALGSGLDYQLNSREEMFVPVVMMDNASKARFSDGRPLVKATRVLNEGRDTAVLPPTPWYAGPTFWAWVAAFITACVIFFDFGRRVITVPYFMLWFFLLGLAGSLVSFLVFISVHEATSPNVLVVWLNPLQFLFIIGLCGRRLRPLAMGMAYYNMIAVGVLLIASPFINQSLNPAFYPLMLATVGLGVTYAIIGNKSSYKSKAKSRKKRR